MMYMWFIKALLETSCFFYSILYWNRNRPRVGSIRKNLRYGNRRHQKLDVILPPAGGNPPVILYAHGGSFIGSDKRYYTRICCEYAAAGFAVFNINYGLAPKHRYPSQLEDLGEAIAWVVKNRDSFGCDPGRLFLAGDSAGAYLAAQYASTRYTGSSVCGFVLFYGSYDLAGAAAGGFPLMKQVLAAVFAPEKDDPDTMNEASPIRHIPDNFPPESYFC